MTKIQTLSKRTIARMSECFRRTLTPMPQQATAQAGRAPGGVWYWAKLTSALSAPVDGMAAPTHATFDVWVPDGVSSPPGVTLIRSTDPNQQGLTLYNRFTGLSANIATIVQVEYAWGEWTLKGSDC